MILGSSGTQASPFEGFPSEEITLIAKNEDLTATHHNSRGPGLTML